MNYLPKMVEVGDYYSMNALHEIPIADIESALATLWESQTAKNNIRANLYNLIIYASEKSRAQYLQSIVQRVVEQFPGRILFIQVDNDPSKEDLKAFVANTITGRGDTAIACDKILFEVSQSLLQRIPFVILPHLLPDLPIYLLWGEDPTIETQILPSIRPYATRLIFDSECTKNLLQFSQKILTDLKKWKMEIMDVNWATLTPWRDILANICDIRERVDLVRTATSIRLSYNSTPSELVRQHLLQSFYLQGWIASQLGWTYRSSHFDSSRKTIDYATQEGSCQVVLVPQLADEKPPGAILDLDIYSSGERMISILHDPKQPRVVVRISRGDLCEMPFTLPLPDMRRGTAFMKEIFYRTISDHYYRMLALLSHLNFSSQG
jgi:hypothetical protein